MTTSTNPSKQALESACQAQSFRTLDMGDHVRLIAIDTDPDGDAREAIAKACGFEHTGDGGGHTFQCPQTGAEKEETWIEVRAKAQGIDSAIKGK